MTTAMTMQDRNKAVLAEFYGLFSTDAFRRKDFSALDAILAPTFTDHDLIPGQGPGIAGLKDAFAIYYDAFPDFAITVVDMIAEGDRVAVQFQLSGTFSGSFMGIPGTNASFSGVPAIGVIRLNEAGQPTDRWGLADMNALLAQVGVAL